MYMYLKVVAHFWSWLMNLLKMPAFIQVKNTMLSNAGGTVRPILNNNINMSCRYRIEEDEHCWNWIMHNLQIIPSNSLFVSLTAWSGSDLMSKEGSCRGTVLDVDCNLCPYLVFIIKRPESVSHTSLYGFWCWFPSFDVAPHWVASEKLKKPLSHPVRPIHVFFE